jgi:3-oxoacyl-[acyl-carrier protein] reductase
MKPQDISLQDKTALVTGGAAGIGFAIAETLANFGANVIVVDKDEERLESAQARLSEHGDRVVAFRADVTSAADIQQLHEEVVSLDAGLDILVNNVGDHLNLIKPFLESTEEEWDAIYEINVKQMMRCTRVFAPLMRDAGRGGSIINISSIEGYRAIPTCAAYGAMKTAISGFVRTMAIELAPYQIRINAIAPETTETEQVDPKAFTKPEHLDKWSVWNPLGRWGQPGDTAGAALFLASEMSTWVSGTTLHVDGGALAAGGWYRMPGEDQHWTLAPVIKESGFTY